MPSSTSCQSVSSMLPARSSAQYFQTSLPEPSGLSVPVASEHRTCGHVDRRQVHADRAHEETRRRLVAAAHEHRTVDGMRPQELFRLHREEVAIHHRRGFEIRLRHRLRRQLHRETTRLPYAAFDFLDALLEMRVARVQIAPCVDDRDHGLAAEVFPRVAHLQRARAVTERAEVFRAEPFVTAQVFGTLALRHGHRLLREKREEHGSRVRCFRLF